MSEEIQSLIANFQDKFDSEFNVAETSAKVEAQSKKQPESFHQPEVQEKVSNHIQENTMKKQIRPSESDDIHRQMTVNKSTHSEQKQLFDDQKQQQQPEGFQPQDEENRYRQLSNKLETALKKISSTRKVSEPSNGNYLKVLERFEKYEKKKQKTLNEKRSQQEEKKHLQFRDRPQINDKSRQIVAEIHQKPLYQRYQDIVDERKKKISQNEQLKKVKQEKDYEQFLEQYNSHTKVPEKKRKNEKFFSDMKSWKDKLDEQREKKVEQKIQSQLDGYTFQPSLNENSLKMINKKKRVPIHEREIEKPRLENYDCTFKPNLKKPRIK